MKTPLLPLLLAFVLGGCGQEKISQKNFDKIQQGMSPGEVEAILGKPTEDRTTGEPTVHVWDGHDIRIVIIYSPEEKVFIKKAGKREQQ